MTQARNNQEEIKNYEKLQNEYKKLLAEYNDIKLNNSSGSMIEEKIKELTEKQKAIQKLNAELT